MHRGRWDFSRILALHVQTPEFNPWNHKKRRKEEKRENKMEKHSDLITPVIPVPGAGGLPRIGCYRESYRPAWATE